MSLTSNDEELKSGVKQEQIAELLAEIRILNKLLRESPDTLSNKVANVFAEKLGKLDNIVSTIANTTVQRIKFPVQAKHPDYFYNWIALYVLAAINIVITITMLIFK